MRKNGSMSEREYVIGLQERNKELEKIEFQYNYCKRISEEYLSKNLDLNKENSSLKTKVDIYEKLLKNLLEPSRTSTDIVIDGKLWRMISYTDCNLTF